MIERPLYSITVKATADVTAHRFVTTAGAYPVTKTRAFGVAREAAAVGDNVGVHTLGTAIVEAAGAIVAGAAVEVLGAVGKAGTFTTGVKAGIALTPAAADGDLIEVYLVPSA